MWRSVRYRSCITVFRTLCFLFLRRMNGNLSSVIAEERVNCGQDTSLYYTMETELRPKETNRLLRQETVVVADSPHSQGSYLLFILVLSASTLMLRFLMGLCRSCAYEYVWEVTDAGQITRRLRRKPWYRPSRPSQHGDGGTIAGLNSNNSSTQLSTNPRVRNRTTGQQARRQMLLEQINLQRRQNGENPLSLSTLSLILRRTNNDFDPNDYDALWTLQEEQESSPFQSENGDVEDSNRSNFFDWTRYGLTQQEVERFPSRIISESDYDFVRRDVERKSCSICLEDIQVGDHVRTLPCFHMYHSSCIDPWLRKQTKCPICKEVAIA